MNILQHLIVIVERQLMEQSLRHKLYRSMEAKVGKAPDDSLDLSGSFMITHPP